MMAGLSGGFLADLRKVLLNCGPFYSGGELRALFVDHRLKPWRDNLPDASSNMGRVDAVISYLVDGYNRNNENALWLLLNVLRDRTDPDDACHDQLGAIARRLKKELNQPTAAAMPASKPPTSASDPIDLVHLHQLLAQTFSLEELRTLCFTLNVDFDDLPGEGKEAKARELVTYLERRGRITDLIAKVKHERPHVPW
jgi:hypothetical protein